VQSRLCNQPQRPLPEEYEDAQDEVDDLEEGYRFHGAIEVFGEKVPEYLGPEEAFYGRGDLIYKFCK